MISPQVLLLVLRHSHRPLFILLSHVERVLEDRVHDSSNAKGWLDDVGDNLLHCWAKRDRHINNTDGDAPELWAKFGVASYHAEFSGTSSH